jgi:hypothetical protein
MSLPDRKPLEKHAWYDAQHDGVEAGSRRRGRPTANGGLKPVMSQGRLGRKRWTNLMTVLLVFF